MKMAHSLERELVLKEMMRPRLCYLSRGDIGYGFHLHGERTKGAQYIRKIDPGSPAELSGLRSGDRLVEVNGENVERDSHHIVVQKIRAHEHRTRLLVVDRETDEYLRFHGLSVTEDRAVEMGSLSPSTSVTSSPRNSAASSPRASATPSPCASFTIPRLENMVKAKRAMSPLLRDDSSLLRDDSSLLRDDSSLRRDDSSPSYTDSKAERCRVAANGSVMYHGKQQSSSPVTLTPMSGNSTDISGSASDTSAPETSPLPPKDHRPRLCHIQRNELGYGFNLHSDKKRQGQYIRCVDPDSPAEHAGLRPRDRLVEVNGMNIEHLTHAEVVAVIKRGGKETTLLVVDPETDELFKRLSITPTNKHLEEDCVDGPFTDDNSPEEGDGDTEDPETEDPETEDELSVAPSPITADVRVVTMTRVSPAAPPVINVTVMDPAGVTNHGSPRHFSQDSSSSHSTLSEMSADLSSSDNSSKMVDEDERPRLDPFWQNGLRLSPTAAEAKQRVRSKRPKKRAPPMGWSEKKQLFSNF
ncbi:Na(+)/H(+) exchange regulatory cofactor NHE-RF2-like [Engraulis encrasicolus]|uniref:Na(+)/H(+) exchange regulatory cofactor NHE-RF2-like n=1 Tax=Engraulis encrasicolus TaxID=184585 RepID=UPI002FD05E3B